MLAQERISTLEKTAKRRFAPKRGSAIQKGGENG
jgi:hypothetical protein